MSELNMIITVIPKKVNEFGHVKSPQKNIMHHVLLLNLAQSDYPSTRRTNEDVKLQVGLNIRNNVPYHYVKIQKGINIDEFGAHLILPDLNLALIAILRKFSK